MGTLWGDEDNLISSQLDLANLRFAPFEVVRFTTKSSDSLSTEGGISEMVELQRKFNVFSKEHSLKDSFAVLGLAGYWNHSLRAKLYYYLDVRLRQCGSDTRENEIGRAHV